MKRRKVEKAALSITKATPSHMKSEFRTFTRGNTPGANMDQTTHNKIVSFLWGIADDVLRDLFKRGKYPDVILPMCVLRRLDAVLEPTKKSKRCCGPTFRVWW
jgi:hypothetical protein